MKEHLINFTYEISEIEALFEQKYDILYVTLQRNIKLQIMTKSLMTHHNLTKPLINKMIRKIVRTIYELIRLLSTLIALYFIHIMNILT